MRRWGLRLKGWWGWRLLAFYIRRWVEVIYPPRCVACGQVGNVLCGTCLRSFPPITSPFCRRCGYPLATPTDKCPSCQRDILCALDRARSAAHFRPPVREAIHALKYRGVQELAPILGAYMAARLRASSLRVDLVVPVPLHAERRRERGYNQAELLAHIITRTLTCPLVPEALERVRATSPQAFLPFEERRANVKDAFHCPCPERVQGCRVLLVDDVMTTGCTLEACAQALKHAGAREVWGYTLARAALPGPTPPRRTFSGINKRGGWA